MKTKKLNIPIYRPSMKKPRKTKSQLVCKNVLGFMLIACFWIGWLVVVIAMMRG